MDFNMACLNPSSGLKNRNLMNCKVLFAQKMDNAIHWDKSLFIE